MAPLRTEYPGGRGSTSTATGDETDPLSVHTAGDQNVDGIKTFLALPVLPAGTPSGQQAASAAYVIAVRDALIAAAPGALDTLNELAASLGNDANFAATVTTALAGKVSASLYDANTILAANADNTPAALTIGEQTVVGRITGGNIAALTPAQARTLLDLQNIYADKNLLGTIQSVSASAVGATVTFVPADYGALELTLDQATTQLAHDLTGLPAGTLYEWQTEIIQDATGGRALTYAFSPVWDDGESAPAAGNMPANSHTLIIWRTKVGSGRISGEVHYDHATPFPVTLDAVDAPVANVNVNGYELVGVAGVRLVGATKSANYTVTDSECVIDCDTTSGPITVTLPTLTGRAERLYIVRDAAGTAQTNAITIATTSGQTLNTTGATSMVINVKGGAAVFSPDSTRWNLVASHFPREQRLILDTITPQTNTSITLPPNTKAVRIHGSGSGGQGASGRKGATSTVRCGGGAGSGGGWVDELITDPTIIAAGIAGNWRYTVGAGGTGSGAAQTTNSTDGNAGAAGNESTVQWFDGSSWLTFWRGRPGSGGSGGTATAGTGGSASTGDEGAVGLGASASTTGGAGASGGSTVHASTGGGSGGGIGTGNTAVAGGSSGSLGIPNRSVAGGAASTVGTAGTAPSTIERQQGLAMGDGGGGGGSSITTNAGAGGAGAVGGGGGGGGAALDSTGNSGAGGDGGPGCIVMHADLAL